MNGPVWLTLGGILGLFTLTMQRWTIDHLLSSHSNRAVIMILSSMLMRLALVAGILLVALKDNILAAILILSGWWLIRSLSLILIDLKLP